MSALPLGFLLNGWALLGMGAALTSVPIVIHLLNRRRVRTVPWAAMAWLLAAMRRNQRRLQLENWLVLALRVAAVLLLGLALARPVLTDSALAGLAGQRRSVYLLVDTSASTGARREARSVSDAVKAQAAAVLEGLGPEDAFAVVLTNDPRLEGSDGRLPSVLTPRTSGSSAVARAKEQVAALPVREAPAGWREALDVLARQLADEDVARQVVIVTDLTASDWSLGEAPQRVGERLSVLVRRGCRITFVDVGGAADRRGNLGLVALETRSDREAFPGRPVPLAVRVANHGREALEGALVTVEVRDPAGTEVFRRTRLAPRLEAADPATGKPGMAVVDVDLPPAALPAPGSYLLEASVGPPATRPDADTLGLDSRRAAPLLVRPRVRVLAWTAPSQGGRTPPLTFLSPAFDPLPVEDGRPAVPAAFEMTHVDGRAESPFAQRLAASARELDLVVLANVAPRAPAVVEALRAFVRDGGALLVFTGDALTPAMLNEPFHEGPAEQRLLPYPLGAPELRPADALPAEAPFHLDLLTPSEAAWAAPFTGPGVAQWLGRFPPLMRGRMPFLVPSTPPTPASAGGPDAPPTPAGPRPEGIVLRWQEGGGAAVVEGRLGLGRTLWVGTSLDDGWLTVGVPFFLPVLLEEAALHLTRPALPPAAVLVGQTLEAVLPRGAAAERLLAPGGRDVPLKRLPSTEGVARVRVAAERTGQAGAWRLLWRAEEGAGAEQSQWCAVNPDPAEGALAPAHRLALLAALGAEAPVEFLDAYRGRAPELQTVREGEITRLLLWALLGLLALESLLAWALGRRAGPAAPTGGAA